MTYALPWGQRTLVMGILNLTPDSFHAGSRVPAEMAIARARQFQEEGADIIDAGAESTRPGAAAISAEEELARLSPFLDALGDSGLAIPVSIDTQKAVVAEAALRAGACIVNDVLGLQGDPGMAPLVASRNAGIIVMHNRHKVDPACDIVADVRAFFMRSLAIAEKHGIPRRRIILDPGIGFGKSQAQNLLVLKSISLLKSGFGLPFLVGVSRKSFMGQFLGLPVERRLHATIAASVLAVAGGADAVRVHDVRAHVEACRLADLLVAGGAR